MTYRTTRRGVAAGAATAIAIGTLAAFGTSIANAAPGDPVPVVRDWSDQKTTFKRTISNGTPGVGETITVTTKWSRGDNITETIQWASDVNPPCLTYVPGSATMNGSPVTPVVIPTRATVPPSGTVTINGSWANAPGTNNPTYSVQYKVGANCALGTLQTGMDYNGDRGAGYYGFGGPNITATKGNPTTTLAPATGKIGQPTTLTATVAPIATGSGGHTAGNPVEFYDGTNKVGQGNLDSAGNATLAWTPTTVGTHALTAKFLGTATANQSVSAVQNVEVTPADVTTTTSVTVPADAVAGTDVTLGVQVSPVPTGGTVQFKDGTTNIGSPVTLDTDGKGSTTQQFAAGTRSITAVYTGAGEFLTSTSTPSSITVTTPAPADVVTTTALTLPSNVKTGVAVNLWAAVKAPNGDLIPSGGQVTFKDGSTPISTSDVIGGEANVLHTFATAGTHNITAEFTGAAGYLTSVSQSEALTVTDPAVDDQATTTMLTVPATATKGTAVDLVAAVSPTPAGGTVQFMDGATKIGTPVTVVNGKATLKHTFTSAGDRHITAVYSGATGYLNSTAAAATVAVTETPGGGNTGSLGSLGNIFGS